MQISKSLLVIWATLLCAGSQLVSAAETDAQIKAREALRKKMEELQPGSGEATVPAAKVVPQETPAPAKPPKQVAKPAPGPTVTPAETTPEVVTTPPVDSEAVARAREAVRKKMQELQVQPVPETRTPAPPVVVKPPHTSQPPPQTTSTPTPSAVVRTAPPPAPAPPTVTPTSPSPQVAPPPVTPAPQPVVHQPEVPPPAPAPTPAPAAAPSSTSTDRQTAEQAAQNQAKTKPATTKAPPKTTTAPAHPFRPIEGPPLNISAEKQQRLAELLRRYQADEVTPAQYHQERAKILAQP